MDADAEVYAKHADELVRFATSLVGPTVAADVVSDALVRTMTSPRWPDVAHRRAYLFKAVLNESRMHHRSAMAREANELLAAPPQRADETILRTEVAQALVTLDLRQRAVVFLTYWEDLEAIDVSRWLGVSVRTVRRDLATAKQKLRGLLHD